jgi:hypothetical protein
LTPEEYGLGTEVPQTGLQRPLEFNNPFGFAERD